MKCPRVQKWLSTHRHRPSTSDYSFTDTTENLTLLGILPSPDESSTHCPNHFVTKLAEAISSDPLPLLWTPELPQHQKAICQFAERVLEDEKKTCIGLDGEQTLAIKKEAIEVCCHGNRELVYHQSNFDKRCLEKA